MYLIVIVFLQYREYIKYFIIFWRIYGWIMNKTIFLATAVFATLIFGDGHAYAGTKVWGLSNIQKVSSKSSAPYTVYIGSYTSQKNAQQVQSKFQAKGYSAKVQRERNLYIVSVGPLATLQELHQLSSMAHKFPSAKILGNGHPVPAAHPNKKPLVQIPQSTGFKDEAQNHIKCKDCALEHNHWFAQLQGGVVFPLSESNMVVNNGSNFPPPANVDAYSVDQSNQGTIALTVGERMAIQSSFINHYTLSGRLQYVFPTDVGDTIMQYSLPQFLNYSYNWKLSTLALTADTKLNLFNFSKFSPYVNGGLGVSSNQARSFNETAFLGVTSRVSPAFSNHTLTQFTYHVGAGLDYLFTPNWILSAGYEFESFGDFASGNGKSTWSGESLRLGTYQTNTLLFGVTYLVD